MSTVARRPTPRDIDDITFEDARIVFRNFSGKEGQYNREGDRNFALIIDNRDAEQMLADGWNIKYLKPREEGEEPQAYMQVAVSYKVRPPRTVMITSKGRTNIPEDLVDIFDWVDIEKVDLIVHPSHWAVNGKTGIKAYLKSLFLTQREDELELKYADVPDSALGAIEGRATQLAIESGPNDGSIYAEYTEDE